MQSDPKIRLVISDIDGTLVRHDKSLPEANVAAIARLTARGTMVSLISARGPEGMAPIIAALGLDGPFGAYNGGTIFGADGAISAEVNVPDDLARALIGQFAAAGVSWWVFAGGRWLASDLANPHIVRERISSALEPHPGDAAALPVRADKLVAVCDDPALMARIETEARALAGSRANVCRSQTYYLDVTAPAANKGDGVIALAAAFGVPLAQVAVMGDQANDVAMFRVAGYAVAMGQASAEVKAAATASSASNEDAGVADAIDRLIWPRLA